MSNKKEKVIYKSVKVDLETSLAIKAIQKALNLPKEAKVIEYLIEEFNKIKVNNERMELKKTTGKTTHGLSTDKLNYALSLASEIGSKFPVGAKLANLVGANYAKVIKPFIEKHDSKITSMNKRNNEDVDFLQALHDSEYGCLYNTGIEV